MKVQTTDGARPAAWYGSGHHVPDHTSLTHLTIPRIFYRIEDVKRNHAFKETFRGNKDQNDQRPRI